MTKQQTQMNEDYKLFINERFEGITKLMSAHFINVDNSLAKIEEQTEKINIRVTAVEKDNLLHLVNCPIQKDLQDFKNSMTDVNFFSKHPRLGISIIGCFVLGFLFTAYTLINNQKTIYKASNTHTEQIMNQADSIDNNINIYHERNIQK